MTWQNVLGLVLLGILMLWAICLLMRELKEKMEQRALVKLQNMHPNALAFVEHLGYGLAKRRSWGLGKVIVNVPANHPPTHIELFFTFWGLWKLGEIEVCNGIACFLTFFGRGACTFVIHAPASTCTARVVHPTEEQECAPTRIFKPSWLQTRLGI